MRRKVSTDAAAESRPAPPVSLTSGASGHDEWQLRDLLRGFGFGFDLSGGFGASRSPPAAGLEPRDKCARRADRNARRPAADESGPAKCNIIINILSLADSSVADFNASGSGSAAAEAARGYLSLREQTPRLSVCPPVCLFNLLPRRAFDNFCIKTRHKRVSFTCFRRARGLSAKFAASNRCARSARLGSAGHEEAARRAQ